MKSINVRGITESLSDGEMKQVKGGDMDTSIPYRSDLDPDGGGSGHDSRYDKCIAMKLPDYSEGYHCYYGSTGAMDAEQWAGKNGWWCCNCNDAIEWCYSIQ